jgi:hypothetical protein
MILLPDSSCAATLYTPWLRHAFNRGSECEIEIGKLVRSGPGVCVMVKDTVDKYAGVRSEIHQEHPPA